MANSGDIELSQLRFDLHALDRVIVVDVLKLHGPARWRVRPRWPSNQAGLRRCTRARRKAGRRSPGVVRQNGERGPMRVERDVCPDAADVFLEPWLPGSEWTRVAGLA